MCASGRKSMLELPLKVILTENGASNFLSHKKRLLRFRLADNLDEYGISTRSTHLFITSPSTYYSIYYGT